MPEMLHPAPKLCDANSRLCSADARAVKVGLVFTLSSKTCSKLSLSFPEKERVWGRSRTADTDFPERI